ncbi:hypothetical protein TNCV_4835321 [Trichonephila clavipes]|nr:hypothetical protein TNCV_4835321 [Trichonephila clavipes]
MGNSSTVGSFPMYLERAEAVAHFHLTIKHDPRSIPPLALSEFLRGLPSLRACLVGGRPFDPMHCTKGTHD